MPQDWLKQLRNEIETSGKSRYAIAEETGIGESMLGRLMSGRGVSVATAERLADYFGLELTRKKIRKSNQAAELDT